MRETNEIRGAREVKNTKLEGTTMELLNQYDNIVLGKRLDSYSLNIPDLNFAELLKKYLIPEELLEFIMIQFDKTRMSAEQLEQSISNISMYQNLSAQFIRKHQDILDLQNIVEYQNNLPIDLLEQWVEKKLIDAKYIGRCQVLPISFLEKWKDELNWKIISVHQVITDLHIEKFSDKIKWALAVKYQKFPSKYLTLIRDQLNSCRDICIYQPSVLELELSDFGLRKEDWLLLCKFHAKNFTVEFMDQYQEFFNDTCWYYISKFRYITKEIADKFYDYLYLDCSKFYGNLDPEVVLGEDYITELIQFKDLKKKENDMGKYVRITTSHKCKDKELYYYRAFRDQFTGDDWKYLSERIDFSEMTIREISESVRWDKLSKHSGGYSDEFLYEFQDCIRWSLYVL